MEDDDKKKGLAKPTLFFICPPDRGLLLLQAYCKGPE